MNGSATAIWIIVGVAVAGLVVWLGSVAPRRDEEAKPGEVPPGDSLHPGGPEAAFGRRRRKT
jgi:hypothetical protein